TLLANEDAPYLRSVHNKGRIFYVRHTCFMYANLICVYYVPNDICELGTKLNIILQQHYKLQFDGEAYLGLIQIVHILPLVSFIVSKYYLILKAMKMMEEIINEKEILQTHPLMLLMIRQGNMCLLEIIGGNQYRGHWEPYKKLKYVSSKRIEEQKEKVVDRTKASILDEILRQMAMELNMLLHALHIYLMKRQRNISRRKKIFLYKDEQAGKEYAWKFHHWYMKELANGDVALFGGYIYDILDIIIQRCYKEGIYNI
ncbi:hypothetical protein ACJX0J_012322, partial [Zea mays]